jgi:NAD(P)H-dependent flavin oxidoreductase YrpB (nitropropane dioxygenase family)
MTMKSDVHPKVKQRWAEATEGDTPLTNAITGVPLRKTVKKALFM